MRSLRPLIIMLGFLLLTLPLMPIQLLLRSNWLPQAYHRILCRLLGINIVVEGHKPVGPALLVSNHVSWLDIPVLSAVLPASFIAKREVGRWPLFGWMANLQASVFINRENRHSTGQSRHEIADRLKSGDILVLFPEGTSGDGNHVRGFKSSFFGAVYDLDVPVIPVTIAYQAARNLPLTRRQRPAIAWYGDMELLPHLWVALLQGPLAVTVCFHNALEPEPRKQMAQTAENVVRRGLAEALHGKAKIR